jgi:glyoxylase-like metal-dependent hydrolase (beta-lactamase superfamily II)/rhodanese-related sulfurtransferase
MYFQQILNQRHGCASYLIASRDSGAAAIVDPALETEPYDALLRARNLRLCHVIDTHIHADHVSGARALAARHDAELCLHEQARTTYPFRALRDGDVLALDRVQLRVIHTPGHRPELVSFQIADLARSADACYVLTADCLLAGDVGRPDFGGGDAAAQYASVQRLLALPEGTAVFPGHFEGPCGANMDGRPSTTIGFERLHNPLARLDREAFVAEVSTHLPERPLNMVAIEATNRGLADDAWAMLTADPEVTEIAAADLEPARAGTLLVDVREPHEYARGHIPGALSLPQAEIATRLDELPRTQLLVLVCRSGSRSRGSAQFLAQVGYERVANVAGGMLAWRRLGRPMERDTEAGAR